SKLTRSQVQHDSGLIQARLNSQRWIDNIKLKLQHLAAATPAGTSLVAIQRHVAVTLATWDGVLGEYLHPKWAEQKMRLHGAQEKVLERYFKKVLHKGRATSHGTLAFQATMVKQLNLPDSLYKSVKLLMSEEVLALSGLGVGTYLGEGDEATDEASVAALLYSVTHGWN
ncbi:uncharacterized protein HaLaN_16689, partial [Haematococcus lacustris]